MQTFTVNRLPPVLYIINAIIEEPGARLEAILKAL